MADTMTLPAVSSFDSLDQYMRAIKSFPILSAEEEHSLATRLQQHNDVEAAKSLVVSHLRLVASIARHYSGYGLPQSDLIQEGNIGLMKAVRRFDPERGVRLVSFAMHWIKAEIHEYIVRNWRLVKVATTKAQRKLFFNLRSMKSGLSASLQSDEVAHIARELNVKPEEVLEMESRMSGHEISLEGNPDDDGEDIFSPISYLQAAHAEPSEILVEQETERLHTTGLSTALAKLDNRSRRIVEARWLQEGNNATLHDLATEFGVSAERIRQIEQKAMKQMKGFLSQD